MASTDVLILTALQDELTALLKLGGEWAESRDLSGFRYFHISLTNRKNETFHVAAAWIGEMGERSAVSRGQQLLTELAPACLAMCGICAGYREKVSLGDVIVADQIWNYDEGKRTEDGFSHATRMFDMQSTWKMDAAFLAKEMDLAPLSALRPPAKAAQMRWFMHALAAHETEGKSAPVEHADRNAACPNWASVVKYLLAESLIERKGRVFVSTAKGRDWVDEDSLMNPDGLPKEPPLRVHVGAVATGSAVVEDPGIFERLRQNVRSTIAIEMEGAALGELATRFQKQMILVKAVQDFADHDKDDGFRAFACKASATFLLAFLQKHFETLRSTDKANLKDEAPEGMVRRFRGDDFERENPFLRRVENLVQLRHQNAKLTRQTALSPFAGLIEVETDAGGYSRLSLVAALDAPITEEFAMQFTRETHERYRARHPNLQTMLVHQGKQAPSDLRERLDRMGITLQTFDQYQGLFDLTSYLEAQTERLGKNEAYLPAHYVPQSAWVKLVGHREPDRTESALQSIWDLLRAPAQQRFLLVLGEFGTGKTFLLRELCRQMVKGEHPVWPVLLDMSKLEKQHQLSELLAAHFAKYEVPGYNYKAFQYLLSEGKIALFFDGFDELADRATYENAKDHFDTVISATQGNAKIVLSSRRQHFLTDGEIHQAVETEFARHAASAAQAGYRLFLLELFQEHQIRQYLRNVLVDEAAADSRYRLIDEVKDLLGLSHNPRMLAFIASIPEASLREARQEKGEVSAASLYEILVKRWLDFEHERSLRRGPGKGISRAALEEGMMALALSMWRSRAKMVGVEEIRDIIGQAMITLGEPKLDPDVITHLFASGSLLVRDAEGRFSFLHRSVLEWLVAREAAIEMWRGDAPVLLAVDEMGALMADFFTAMSGRERAAKWARAVMLARVEPVAMKNAGLILQRMGDSFEVVDLEGQDLRGKNFAGVNWVHANLRRTDLRGVVLNWANLRGASLVGANLSRADLSRSMLENADLTNSNFSFARLANADLSEACPFDSRRFRGANLLAAKGILDEYHAALVAEGAVPPELREVAPMWANASRCNSVAFSPDGVFLAAGFDNGTAWLVDTVADKVLRVFWGHSSAVRSVVFHPDGRILASGSEDNTVRLWDVSTGQLLRAFEGHSSAVFSIAFHPDGKTLASGSDDNTVRLWDVSTGRLLSVFEGHASAVLSVVFDPEGQTFASGSYDKIVRLWDVSTGRLLRAFEGHTAGVRSVVFDPEGQILASGSDDNTVRLWDVSTGRLRRVLSGHSSWVTSLVFDPGGKTLVSGSSDKTIGLWDVSTGRLLRAVEGHSSAVLSVFFDPESKTLASGSDDETFRLWDLTTARSLRTFKGHTNVVRRFVFSPDGKTLASCSDDKSLRLWDLTTGRLLRAFRGHKHDVTSVVFSPDGRTLVAGSYDDTFRFWDVTTGRLLRTFEGRTLPVTSVVLTPDGKTLAWSSSDDALRLWDLTNERFLRTFGVSGLPVRSIVFAPDGKTFAASSDDGSLRLWDLMTGRLVHNEWAYLGYYDAVSSVGFDPDGKTLAFGSHENTVCLSDVSTGLLLRAFEGHSAAVLSVVFAPDGKTLASGSQDKTVRLWEVSTGRLLHAFEGHSSAVRSLVFAPDGKTLASGSDDNTVRLWDVQTSTCLAILLTTKNGWVAFTPDGRYKYSGEIAGSFWHIAGLCRFEPGELDLLLPDDADFRNLPPPPTSIKPWRRPTS